MDEYLKQKSEKIAAEALTDLKAYDASSGWEIFSTDKKVKKMRKRLGNLFLVRGVCDMPLFFETIRDFL